MILFADKSKRVMSPIDGVDIPPFHGLGGGGGLWNGGLVVQPLMANGGSGGGGSGGGGGVGLSSSGVSVAPPLVGSNSPTQRFDITALSGLRPSDKYLGKNRVSDIVEAYETYISGTAVGRGGQYAVDAARKYGVTLTEAARGYLSTVGLPTLADILPGGGGTGTGGGGGGSNGDFQKQLDDLKKQVTEKGRGPVELLLDAIPGLFGQSVQNPPLQSQAYGYTPVSGDLGGSSGGGIGIWLLLGAVAIAAYFVYKRYSG